MVPRSSVVGDSEADEGSATLSCSLLVAAISSEASAVDTWGLLDAESRSVDVLRANIEDVVEDGIGSAASKSWALDMESSIDRAGDVWDSSSEAGLSV